MLDLIDSQITYSSRYLVGVALAPVRDMALLDPFNPALGRLSGQSNRRGHRNPARAEARRDPRGASQAHHVALRRIDHGAGGDLGQLGNSGDRAAPVGAGERDRDPIFPAGRRPRPGGKGHGTRVNYNVTHITRYIYGATVELTTGVLRLKPVSRDGQLLERFSVKTDPPCLPPTERIDAFGNAVLSLRIEKPHRELTRGGGVPRARRTRRRPRDVAPMGDGRGRGADRSVSGLRQSGIGLFPVAPCRFSTRPRHMRARVSPAGGPSMRRRWSWRAGSGRISSTIPKRPK